MSIAAIRAGVSQALAALADSALRYRLGTSGTWLAISSAVLTTDRPVGIGFDDGEGGEVASQSATMSVPSSAPAIGIGGQVKDHTGAVWAVVEAQAGVAVTFYRLRREILSDAAVVQRGGSER